MPLYDIEDALDRVHRHCDYVDAAAGSVAAQQAQEAVVRESATDWPTTSVRETDQGRAFGDALLGRTVPVREATDALGPVITGPHSHGSVRHSHDRLRGDHLHCMHCGGDSRLCLDSPHHAEGPTPVRESAGRTEGRALGEALFNHDPAHPPRALRYQEALAVGRAMEGLERTARTPSGPPSRGDRGLLEAWDRAMGGRP